MPVREHYQLSETEMARRDVEHHGKTPRKPKGTKKYAKPNPNLPKYRPVPEGSVVRAGTGRGQHTFFSLKENPEVGSRHVLGDDYEINLSKSRGAVSKRLKGLGRRLAKKAKGVGALGATIGAVDTIKAASKAKEEGGSFAAGFGKFVEQMTGFPSGSSGRPLTKKEKRSMYEM